MRIKDPISRISRRSFAGGILMAAAGSTVALGTGKILRSSFAHYQTRDSCAWPTSTAVMPSGAANQIADLPYSDGTYIDAKLVLNVNSDGVALADVFDSGVLVSGNDTIVTNLSNAHAEVFPSIEPASGLSKSLSPRKATIVRSDAIMAKASVSETPSDGDLSAPLHLAFIRTSSPRNLVNALADSKVWQSYTAADCWPEGVGPYPLWMSARAEITNLNLSFDPWKASNQQTPQGEGKRAYDIHTNLWWLPAMSDAAVHHCHYANFLEFHTQLAGIGRMQKFTDAVTRGNCPSSEIFNIPVTLPPPASSYYGVPGTHSSDVSFPSLYEEYRLAPGDTNVPFALVNAEGNFIYPWHQYYAETDCLWVVWEMVPTT